jgi:gluconolactonase
MRVIAEDLWFPEGPVWLGDGSLLVVEIRRGTLTRVWLDGRKDIVAELGGGPNGAAIGPDGACYVCNNGGFRWASLDDGSYATAGAANDYTGGRIEKVDVDTGKFSVLYDRVGDYPLRGPNDLVFDAHGGFYFTDTGKTRPRDADRGSVCYAKADGSFIQEIIFPISRPNGIGLSPDGSTLYVSETETARLWAWPLEAPGRLAVPTSASTTSPHGGTLIHAASTYMRFDSLAVEAGGKICVGTLDKGGVTVCDPDGEARCLVPVPGDTHITNICFGGPDLKKAYITQAYVGRLVEMDWPRPGLPLHGTFKRCTDRPAAEPVKP